MPRMLLIVVVVLCTSCATDNNEELYAKDFLDHMKRASIEIKNDSLIFPPSSGIEPIIIPTWLVLNKKYNFVDKSSQQLTIERTNYTDIAFEIKYDGGIAKGKGSLRPSFYFGVETVGGPEGEYTVDTYDVIEVQGLCLHTIGVGNFNIVEGPTDYYAYLYENKSCELGKKIAAYELIWLKE